MERNETKEGEGRRRRTLMGIKMKTVNFGRGKREVSANLRQNKSECKH